MFCSVVQVVSLLSAFTLVSGNYGPRVDDELFKPNNEIPKSKSYSNSLDSSFESNSNNVDNLIDNDWLYSNEHNFPNQQRQRRIRQDSIVTDDSLSTDKVFIIEDMSFPHSESQFKSMGDLAGIASLPNGNLALLHRGSKHWVESTFLDNKTVQEGVDLAQRNLIAQNTILVINKDDGRQINTFGANLFYLPHGIAADSLGNLWITDVGRHQVMRLPTSLMEFDKKRLSTNARKFVWPDIILGDMFVPGNNDAHFCQPSSVVVAKNLSLVFVADGYCNSRVMVYTNAGLLITTFGESIDMNVVHSLALIDEMNLICVADRENARIFCFKAGLDGNLESIGQLLISIEYPLGKVYAITPLNSNHLLVSSEKDGKFNIAILDLIDESVRQIWTSNDLKLPHSMYTSQDRKSVYVADLDSSATKKIYKFDIIYKKSKHQPHDK